jgi:hypothetical protein
MEGMRDRHERRADLLGMLEERRERRSELMERLGPEARERIRERVRDRLGERYGEGRGERLRERIRDRIAERRGSDGERCFIVTRMLRAEDGEVMAMVRRRVCRD